MTTYRLRYTPAAYNGRFRTFTYPRPSLPGYPTREIAEQMRAAMPEPGRFEVVEEVEFGPTNKAIEPSATIESGVDKRSPSRVLGGPRAGASEPTGLESTCG